MTRNASRVLKCIISSKSRTDFPHLKIIPCGISIIFSDVTNPPSLSGQDVRRSHPRPSPSVLAASRLRRPLVALAQLACPHCILSRGPPSWLSYEILHHLCAELEVIRSVILCWI